MYYNVPGKEQIAGRFLLLSWPLTYHKECPAKQGQGQPHSGRHLYRAASWCRRPGSGSDLVRYNVLDPHPAPHGTVSWSLEHATHTLCSAWISPCLSCFHPCLNQSEIEWSFCHWCWTEQWWIRPRRKRRGRGRQMFWLTPKPCSVPRPWDGSLSDLFNHQR